MKKSKDTTDVKKSLTISLRSGELGFCISYGIRCRKFYDIWFFLEKA